MPRVAPTSRATGSVPGTIARPIISAQPARNMATGGSLGAPTRGLVESALCEVGREEVLRVRDVGALVHRRRVTRVVAGGDDGDDDRAVRRADERRAAGVAVAGARVAEGLVLAE